MENNLFTQKKERGQSNPFVKRLEHSLKQQ